MKVIVWIGCLLFFCLSSSMAQATKDDEKGWVVKRHENEIAVEQRAVEGSLYLATRGTMVVEAGLFDVLAVLRSSDACELWLYKCLEFEQLESVSAADRVYRMVIQGPLFIKDRETYVRSRISYREESQIINIALDGIDDYAPAKRKPVRVLSFRGFWNLAVRSDGLVEVVYQLHSNPQTSVISPVNSTMEKSVFETLLSVRALSLQSPYRGAVIAPEDLLEFKNRSTHTQ